MASTIPGLKIELLANWGPSPLARIIPLLRVLDALRLAIGLSKQSRSKTPRVKFGRGGQVRRARRNRRTVKA